MLAKKIQNEFAISFGSVSVQDPVLNDDAWQRTIYQYTKTTNSFMHAYVIANGGSKFADDVVKSYKVYSKI